VFKRNKKGRENEVRDLGQHMFLKKSRHTMAIGLLGALKKAFSSYTS